MIKTYAVMVSLVLILLTANDVRADHHSGHELLEQWGSQRVGTWKSEQKLEQDIPDLGKKGETLHGTVKWINDGGVFRGEWVGKVNGEVRDSGIAIVGWDGGENGVRVHWFSKKGVYVSTLFKKNGDAWKGAVKLWSPQGDLTKHDASVTFSGNKMITRQTNRKSGDESLPDDTVTSTKQ